MSFCSECDSSASGLALAGKPPRVAPTMSWRLAALLLICKIPALHAQDAEALRLAGDDALASGLWEIAAMRYGDLLTDPGLPLVEKPVVALRLAESWIRGNLPKQALPLLEESFVAELPESRFWKAHALAATGRLADAVEEFGILLEDPSAPYRGEAARSRANLQLALGLDAGALETLSSFAAGAPATEAAGLRLKITGLLLDQGKSSEAREIMDSIGALPPALSKRSAFLEARLLLAEGKPADAGKLFRSLVEEPRGQSLSDHHSAALGLADSLEAAGSRSAAVAGLLEFIEIHPDSPLLGLMFHRLARWLPESPAADDPLLQRLSSWIPAQVFPATGAIAVTASGAAAAWPVRTNLGELASFSMFTRGLALHRIGTPEAKAGARSLMNRLRVEAPSHPLALQALLELGRWELADGKIPEAFSILDAAVDFLDAMPEKNSGTAALRSRAAFLRAGASYETGDLESAVSGFEQAAAELQDGEADLARMNAALARLRISPGDTSTTLIQATGTGNPALEADFELERALSTSAPEERLAAIDRFLTHHADHSRVSEAWLASAEAALEGSAPDLSLARARLDSLQGLPPEALALLPAVRIAMLRLRIEDLSGNPTSVIEVAREILESFPEEPASREASFTLGRNLIHTGDYRDARLVLAKLAAGDEDSARSQVAWLLAAKSAAMGATSQSRDDAPGLFDQAINTDGPIRSLAVLEKGRFMIDTNRLPTAVAFLRENFQPLPEDDPQRLPMGLLLGEAIYAKSSSEPELLEEALEIYDGLLSFTEKYPALRHQLQYRRGRVLELLPRKDDPSHFRDAEALDAYISVIEAGARTPPAEWEYFELCGFRALEMLRAAGRWDAAIALAEKLASFESPNAQDAAEAARNLRLKHMIWDD